MENLGALSANYSVGFAINNAGQVVGDTGSANRGFLYTGTPGSVGTMVAMPPTANGFYGRPADINDAAHVVGSYRPVNDETTPRRAFLYTGTPGAGGVFHDLGTLGGTRSGAGGINNAGRIVGSSSLPGDTATHAFLYTGTPGAGGVMRDLGTLGGSNSFASEINNAGQIIGQSDTASGASHAFLYTGTPGAGGMMVDLTPLAAESSFARGFNDAGFIVGDLVGRGSVLWRNDPAHTVVDLNAWLDAAHPAVGSTLTIGNAWDINNNGLILGAGRYDDGPGGLPDGERNFILDASSLMVPEPSGLAVLALAGSALLRRQQRGSRRK